MKLATLRDGTRDGRLIVVSRDLKRAVAASAVAPTLLRALESWNTAAAGLRDLAELLEGGRAPGAFDLDVRKLAAPLPRTWGWLDGSAFHSHGDLMEKVFKLQPIEGKLTRPLMYQGGSDDLLAACDDMPFPSEEDGIDFEGEIAVIVDRVPMGTPASRALEHIKLVMLANDASLRVLAPVEMKTGFGWVQAKPSTGFSPVAVTPEELGPAWRNGRVCLPLHISWNGREFGHPNGEAMGFGFHELVAHAAYSRNLSAGTIIGSGTVSNETYRTVGSACIAERRGIELVDTGKPVTGYMKFGDRVRIEMFDASGRSIFGDRVCIEMVDASGQSIFGAIDQTMVRAPAAG